MCRHDSSGWVLYLFVTCLLSFMMGVYVGIVYLYQLVG